MLSFNILFITYFPSNAAKENVFALNSSFVSDFALLFLSDHLRASGFQRQIFIVSEKRRQTYIMFTFISHLYHPPPRSCLVSSSWHATYILPLAHCHTHIKTFLGTVVFPIRGTHISTNIYISCTNIFIEWSTCHAFFY